MRGVRTNGNGCFFVERNKYAPWGRGWKYITSARAAPRVWRRGNGKLDDPEKRR